MTIRGWLCGLALVIFSWIALLATVTIMSDQQEDLLFIFPAQSVLRKLPEGVAVTDKGKFWMTVKSEETGVAWAAYKAGTLLVLPAGLAGCFAFLD